MAHYKRKPYKKMPLDELCGNELKDLYIDTFDIGSDNMNSDSLFTNDYELTSYEESDIVKELREEERQGKLTLWSLDDENHLSNDHHKSKESNTLRGTEPKNYDEALVMAKKALKDIANL